MKSIWSRFIIFCFVMDLLEIVIFKAKKPVSRVLRSIDGDLYSNPRSGRSYEFEEELVSQQQQRSPRSPQQNYGAPPQASYGGGGGGGGSSNGGGGGGGGGEVALMPYRYGYAVQDDIGNDFNQQEQSDGDQVC